MRAEPADLDRERVAATLRSTWRMELTEIRYEPAGFGSHHYRAIDNGGARWFVTVDGLRTKPWLGSDPETVFERLEHALQAAVALRSSGLEFIHAPIEGDDGTLLRRIDDTYAVSVFAFIDGVSQEYGGAVSAEDRRTFLTALGRLHASSAPQGMPTTTLAVTHRDELLDAMDDVGATWSGGPYSEPARNLISGGVELLKELLARYDRLVEGVETTAWVVTHGEPHAANIIRDAGGLHLIDWDTVALAPRERDLWMFEPFDDVDRQAYTAVVPAPEPDPAAMELFGLWWQLSEIAGYTANFRAPHAANADTEQAWRELSTYLAR